MTHLGVEDCHVKTLTNILVSLTGRTVLVHQLVDVRQTGFA